MSSTDLSGLRMVGESEGIIHARLKLVPPATSGIRSKMVALL